MFEILDSERHSKFIQDYRSCEKSERRKKYLLIPAIVFSSIGAITWAIRGTSGWGGFDGAVVHGMAWGLLWYYFLYKIGLDGRKTSFWLAIGVSIGGMLGYGIYVSWIRGRFDIDPVTSISINSIYGALGFFVVGLVWLGVGGIFLGWVLGDRHRKFSKNMFLHTWLPRLVVPIIFAGFGFMLTELLPGVFFPYYSESFYTEAQCPICVDRILSTNTTNVVGMFWWIGAMVVAIFQKDNTTAVAGALFGLGFGLLYLISGLWVFGYEYASSYIDWWKMWELAAGLYAGIVYALFMYWCLKQHAAKFQDNHPADAGEEMVEARKNILPQNIQEKRANIYLSLSVFFQFAILCYGGSYMTGVVLELYTEEEIDQYAFPTGRAILFAISMVILLVWLIKRLYQIHSEAMNHDYNDRRVSAIGEKMIYTAAFILLIGEITIWPSEIGIIYALLFIPALYGLLKNEKHMRKIMNEKE